MQEFTVVYPALELHKAGCKELKKFEGLMADHPMEDITAMSPVHAQQVIANQLNKDAGEVGWTALNIKRMPCLS